MSLISLNDMDGDCLQIIYLPQKIKVNALYTIFTSKIYKHHENECSKIIYPHFKHFLCTFLHLS